MKAVADVALLPSPVLPELLPDDACTHSGGRRGTPSPSPAPLYGIHPDRAMSADDVELSGSHLSDVHGTARTMVSKVSAVRHEKASRSSLRPMSSSAADKYLFCQPTVLPLL